MKATANQEKEYIKVYNKINELSDKILQFKEENMDITEIFNQLEVELKKYSELKKIINSK